MLTILCNWIYILITTYVTGHALLFVFVKWLKYDRKLHFLPVMLTGFAIVTAYAGYFSIFHRVSIAANIGLILSCIACMIVDRAHYGRFSVRFITIVRKFKRIFKRNFKEEPVHTGLVLLRLLQFGGAVLILFVIVFYTCYGTFHTDSGLYHAQSIRWIEEYGVVKGEGLTQNRFGYNSAFFSVSALYSFAFLGQSLHGVNGYMAALVTIYAYYVITNAVFERAFGKISTIVAFAPILYTVIGGLELISPSTDPILLYLVFAIILYWTQLLDADEEDVLPFALLCVLTAFLVSVKLSVGVLILLAVDPAVRLIRQKRVKEIVLCILSAVILNLPYLIRNVIISGWLIYPFPSLDLFDLPWKIPKGSAINDANEIRTWARYVNDATKIDQSVFEWAPVWWQGQSQMERLFSLAALAALFFGLVWIVAAFIRLIRAAKVTGCDERVLKLQKKLFLELIIVLSLLFWFFSAPLIRYGYLYLLLTPLMTIAVLKNDNAVTSTMQILIPGVLTCILLYPTGNLLYQDVSYMHHNWSRQYAVFQKDYSTAEVLEKAYAGTTFYYPVEPGTNVWYDAFPSVIYEENFAFMEPIGDSVADGFKIRNK